MLTPKRVADMLEEVDYPDGKYVEVYWHAEEFRELIAAWRAQTEPRKSVVKLTWRPLSDRVIAAARAVDKLWEIAEAEKSSINLDLNMTLLLELRSTLAALDEGGKP